MTHPFSTDAFSGVREFLYSASWSRSIVGYEQQMRTAERMLAGRSCDHALFADVLDWAALRQTCRELRWSMPAQPLRTNLKHVSNGFVAECFDDLYRRTTEPYEHTRALFSNRAPRFSNRVRRHMALILVVIQDREDEAAETDDYHPRSLILWDRLRDAIPEPVTPHARELVGDEMMDV